MSRNSLAQHYGDRMLKESVARVYESDTFDSFLKDVFHPGGLELTRRLATTARLGRNSKVLDIACGKGETPRLLALEYGCRVIGMDLSAKMITLARRRTEAKKLKGEVDFLIADAEELPFHEATFDAVISECSFSLLPNKDKAAAEIQRVLKAQGRVIITDIILRGNVPLGGACPFPLVPCMAGAGSIDDYVTILGQAGFCNPYVEDHSIELKKLGYQMGLNFGGWEGFLQQLSSELLSAPGKKESREHWAPIEAYQTLFVQGRPGYALITATKP